MECYSVRAYPTTFAIDKDGVVADIVQCSGPDMAAPLQRMVRLARAGAPPPALGSKPPAAIPTARNPQPARASTKSKEFNADAVRQHAAKDVAGALESNEQALKLCPDWPQAVISHADNLFHLRRYYESITEWTCAIELDPKRAGNYDGRLVVFQFAPSRAGSPRLHARHRTESGICAGL